MRNLENDYRRYDEINKAYDAAGKTEEAGEKARADYQDLLTEVRAEGDGYGWLMRLYSEMKEKENDRIDLDELRIDAKDALETMKKYGITEFTFSSTWSSTIEKVWDFEQAGAKMLGMTQVNASNYPNIYGEKDLKPAFIFSIA